MLTRFTRRRSRSDLPTGILYLIIGLAVTFGILWLINQVIVQAGAPWEHGVLVGLHGSIGPSLTPAANALTQLGYPDPILAIGLVLIIWWLARGAAWKSGALFLDLILLTVIDYGAKPLFSRPRPTLWPHVQPSGFSFPSGHALFAVGWYGLIAVLVMAGTGHVTRAWIWTVWAVFATALCFTRLILGVHWPTDVIAGALAGGIMLVAQTVALRRWGARL